MTQSLSEIFIHIVFSTKNRDPQLKKDIRYELFSYIAQILKSLNSPSITIGGVEDHIHIKRAPPAADSRQSSAISFWTLLLKKLIAVAPG